MTPFPERACSADLEVTRERAQPACAGAADRAVLRRIPARARGGRAQRAAFDSCVATCRLRSEFARSQPLSCRERIGRGVSPVLECLRRRRHRSASRAPRRRARRRRSLDMRRSFAGARRPECSISPIERKHRLTNRRRGFGTPGGSSSRVRPNAWRPGCSISTRLQKHRDWHRRARLRVSGVDHGQALHALNRGQRMQRAFLLKKQAFRNAEEPGDVLAD